MRNHKFQHHRLTIQSAGSSERYTGETDKAYGRVRGIFVLLPEPLLAVGSSLHLRVGGREIFDEQHDVRLLTCSQHVSPNQRFFLFPEHIEAGGLSLEIKYRDGGQPGAVYPYDVKVYLWLSNDVREDAQEDAQV